NLLEPPSRFSFAIPLRDAARGRPSNEGTSGGDPMKRRMLLAPALTIAALLPSCTGPETASGPAAPAPAPAPAIPAPKPVDPPKGPGAFAPAVEPKPPSDPVKKGLAWPVARQHGRGGG